MSMKCEECHERPATLHLTKVINENKTEIHVCERCAKEKGYISHDEYAYSIHDLLSGLFNFDSSFSKQQSHSQEENGALKCPKCGMTYHQFTQLGKFGCASCYYTFTDNLNPIFRRVHSGNTTHDGKIPKRRGTDLKQKRLIQGCKEKLQQLIQTEAFEEAAKMRDKIKELEKKQRIMEEPKDGDDV